MHLRHYLNLYWIQFTQENDFFLTTTAFSSVTPVKVVKIVIAVFDPQPARCQLSGLLELTGDRKSVV